MLSMKNKFKKRLRGLIGIALAIFLVSSLLCIPAMAESSNIMSDIVPDGTNIPDTDIGGATGMEETSPLGTLPTTLPDTSNGTVPQSGASTSSSIMDDTNMDNNLGRVLGIIIAVIVVLGVIVLIIALVPRKDRFSDNQKKK